MAMQLNRFPPFLRQRTNEETLGVEIIFPMDQSVD